MTGEQLNESVHELAVETKKHVAAKIAPLEERIAALEARRSLRYSGICERGQAYGEQEAVTHQGSLWIATRDTVGIPGTENSAWQLAAKRGRDGKDLR
jgi:hypothetical protein